MTAGRQRKESKYPKSSPYAGGYTDQRFTARDYHVNKNAAPDGCASRLPVRGTEF